MPDTIQTDPEEALEWLEQRATGPGSPAVTVDELAARGFPVSTPDHLDGLLWAGCRFWVDTGDGQVVCDAREFLDAITRIAASLPSSVVH